MFTKLNKLNLTLALSVFLLLFAWLLFDKCDSTFSRKPKRQQLDSTAVHNQLVEYEKNIKELKATVARENRAKDSALDLARQYGRLLSEEKRTAARLSNKLTMAKQNSDTSLYVTTCDSLQLVVNQKNDYIELMQLNYESTISIMAGIAKAKDTTIAEQGRLIDTLRNSLKSSFAAYTAVNSKLDKALKKNDRKYSIGPSITYGIGPDGKLLPVIGISLHRPLFKFKL